VNGQNSILFYAKQLFNKITHDNQSLTQLLMVFISIVQLLGVLTSTKVIDKVGRKKLILHGQALLIICLFGVFVFNKLLSNVFS
jgi:MFS family permease